MQRFLEKATYFFNSSSVSEQGEYEFILSLDGSDQFNGTKINLSTLFCYLPSILIPN